MSYAVSRIVLIPVVVFFALAFFVAGALAQGPPPARVVVVPVVEGKIADERVFTGTIYYESIAELAGEVSGKVVEVNFDEGDRIKEGSVLVALDIELLLRTIDSLAAKHNAALVELERASADMARTEQLFKDKYLSEQDYDMASFNVQGKAMEAEALAAQLSGLEVELSKTAVRAPFSGVVISRDVELGEWVEPGKTLGRVAKGNRVEVVVEVNERVLRFVKRGMGVSVDVGGKSRKGKVVAVVPSGDVRSRTFPVKISIRNDGTLYEGMEALVSLPTAARVPALIVPRDAVINKFGMVVVFVVIDGKAKMFPVSVAGFSGLSAGLLPGPVQPGMQVVVKGNERIMEGQPVMVMGGGPAGTPSKGPGKRPPAPPAPPTPPR